MNRSMSDPLICFLIVLVKLLRSPAFSGIFRSSRVDWLWVIPREKVHACSMRKALTTLRRSSRQSTWRCFMDALCSFTLVCSSISTCDAHLWLFQFPESLRGAGYGFAALTSAYSELYFTKERMFMRMLRFPYNFLKYFTRKEILAKRLVEINKNVQIDFTKASMEFFNSKVVTFVNSLKGPRLPINKTFKTEATAQLVFSETQGKTLEVPVPSSSIDPGPVSCRLMSATRRKGMVRHWCICKWQIWRESLSDWAQTATKCSWSLKVFSVPRAWRWMVHAELKDS